MTKSYDPTHPEWGDPTPRSVEDRLRELAFIVAVVAVFMLLVYLGAR